MAEHTQMIGSTTETEETDLTTAANYYIKRRKTITAQNERARNYLTDQNITLLEMTAEAYGLPVEALAKKVTEIDRQ